MKILLMNLPMVMRIKSISFVTLVLCLLPLPTNYVLSRADAQTPTENPKTATDQLFEQGVQQYRHGQYLQALQTYQRVLQIRRQQNNKPGIAQTLNNIGEVYNVLTESDKALEVLQPALAIRRELKDRAGEGETLDNIGSAYLLKKQYDLALGTLQQALAIRREVKDKTGVAKTLSKIGHCYSIGFKQYSKGLELLQQALVIQEQVGDKFHAAITLTRIAAAYANLENYPRALESAQKALSLYQEVKNRAGEGGALQQIGAIYSLQNKDDLALPLYQQALPLIRESGILSQEDQVLLSISQTYSSQNKIDSALEFGQQALVFAQKHELRPQQLESLLWLANVYSNRGISYVQKGSISQAKVDYSHVVELSQSALTLARVMKDKKSEADALNQLGSAYNQLNEPQKAVDVLQQAVSIARAIKDLDIELFALSFLSSVYVHQGYSNKVIEIDLREVEIAREQKDKSSETLKLLHLASTYNVKGEHQKARETFQQALAASRQVEINKLHPKLREIALRLEFNALRGISKSDANLGEYGQALDFAQQALKKAQSLKKPELEVEALLDLAFLQYNSFRNFPKAIELSQQALAIARQIKNSVLEANALQNLIRSSEEQGNHSLWLESVALNSLGSYYTSLNDYQKSLAATQQNSKTAQDLKSTPMLILSFFNLGDIYTILGDYTKSRSYYQQALTTAQQLKNRQSEGIALWAQANTYFLQGEPQKTVELSQQALVIFLDIKTPSLEAFAHRMLSIGYGELGNDAKAMAEAQTYLTFARQTQNPLWEKNALNLIGDLHKKFGRKQQAIIAYQQALFITTDNQVTGTNAGIYAGLANIYQSLNQPNIAVTYYKQYINKIEEVRHGIQGLPPELQNSFLNTTVDFNKVKIVDIYRQYANLLLYQGREQDATQVLELLKIQEVKEVSTRGNTASDTPKLPLTSAESQIAAPNPSIIALGIQIRECEQKNCPQKTQLNDQLEAVLRKYNQDLKTKDKEISSRITNDKSAFDPSKLATVREIVSQPGTVMIYPLVLEDKLWLLLYSGNAAQKFEIPVKRAELGKTVKEFRDLMEECEKRVCGSADIAKVQPVSQKLYNWLIKPFETELKKNQVKNLVFALDRETRYVPMSALFDGKQYLIENYTTHNVLSADLTDVHDKLPKGTQNNSVLAMGVSDAIGKFAPLPNVPKELDAIVKTNTSNQGIYPGKEYLNNAFDYRSLRDHLTGYKILHLATHGAFVPGSKDASYLLLGTGDKLAISDIQTLTGLSNIHLVVLSACQTALAAPLQDGVEIASVAYYFLNGGAKAVMASLWQVSDTSTSELMQHFYQNLAQSAQPTKAESLRLAQLTLLYGKPITLENIKRGAVNIEAISSKPSQHTTTSANFAHPYYWAPFILIGNGL